MTRPVKLKISCCGCRKPVEEVRKMIAMNDGITICDECVDICHEIAHEGGGVSTIATSELVSLRAQAQQAALGRIWIQAVRATVKRADDNLNQLPFEKEVGERGVEKGTP